VKERPGVGFEFLHELDQYLFGKGVHYDIFRKLGAHPSTMDGKKGIHFAVWAPHAVGVNLIGEFNGWDEESIPMERLDPVGFWEAFLPEAKEGHDDVHDQVYIINNRYHCQRIGLTAKNHKCDQNSQNGQRKAQIQKPKVFVFPMQIQGIKALRTQKCHHSRQLPHRGTNDQKEICHGGTGQSTKNPKVSLFRIQRCKCEAQQNGEIRSHDQKIAAGGENEKVQNKLCCQKTEGE
jgi:hypothetical protein